MTPLQPKELRQFADVLRLRTGAAMIVRFVEPADVGPLRRYFEGLSSATHYSRFLGATRDLPQSEYERMVHTGEGRHFAVVAETGTGNEKAIVGEARYAFNVEAHAVEFGISVADDWHGTGAGFALLSNLECRAAALGAEHIYGDALPASLKASDVDLGAGVTVTKLVSAAPGEVVVTVDAAPDAKVGVHDVAVGSAVLAAGLPVYKKIDYLKVTPETAIGRLGGSAHFPKGYDQFDAWGFDNGADGKPYTADDVKVGLVEVNWSIEEFQATFYDDDKKFVGTLSQSALFTPNLDGPNPDRSNNRNNYGDVWVVAKAKTEKDANGDPLIGKAYLVVAVPAYKKWDQPEVSQQ